MKDTKDTKEKLINVAARLFAERGYDGVSVRDIVKEAHANLGAVTYHFGSKEGLFSEVLDRKTQPLRELFVKVAESDEPPDEKLSRMLSSFAVHVLHRDPGLRVLFLESILGRRPMPKAAVDGIIWRNKAFGSVVRQGIKDGVFRQCDIENVTWSFFGMLSPYILFHQLFKNRDKKGRFSKRHIGRIVDAALDVFMNGIRR